MKIQIQSQEKFIKEHIISETIEKVSEDYSNIINYSIDELTKLKMRKIAENDDYSWSDSEILSESISQTKSSLEKESKKYNLTANFSKYFKESHINLQPIAKEISRLQENLFISRKEERIGRKEEIRSIIDSQLSFDVIEIGLKGSIESLISIPHSESFELEIERIKSRYKMTGDWFPFEIKIDHSTFILDDDGTIFISIDNLPEDLIKRSRELLEDLANKIYTESK